MSSIVDQTPQKDDKAVYSENSILLRIVDTGVLFLKSISPVEILKSALISLFSNGTKEQNQTIGSLAIDIFIFLKFSLLLWLMFTSRISLFSFVFVLILMFFNVFTYIYYHLWSERECRGEEHRRRRLVSVSSSFLFNALGFSYIYMVLVRWGLMNFMDRHGRVSCLLYSAYLSFFATTDYLVSISLWGDIVVLLQFLTTFVFVSIILSRVLNE